MPHVTIFLALCCVATQQAHPRCLIVYFWLQNPATLLKLTGVLDICCTCSFAKLLRISI